MGLHHREVNHEITLQDIHVEIDGHPVPQVHLSEWPIEDVYQLHTESPFQCLVPKSSKGIQECLPVSRLQGNHPLTNGHLGDTMLCEKLHHVLDHPGRGDNPPLRKWNRLAPKDEIGLNKDLRPFRKIIQPTGKLYRLSNRLGGGIVTNDRNKVLFHGYSLCLSFPVNPLIRSAAHQFFLYPVQGVLLLQDPLWCDEILRGGVPRQPLNHHRRR